MIWINGAVAPAFYSLPVITKLAALCLFLTSLAAADVRPTGKPEFTFTTRPDEGIVELQYRGRRILVYAFATNQFKPYVRELYTLRGENVLLDAPADHLHHHGLMYAIRANGINFWEEQDRPGCQKSIKLSGPTVDRSPGGLPRASFTHTIHWVASEHRAVKETIPFALLVEERTLSVVVDEAQQEVALSWKARFAVGSGASEVILTGSSYNGLGLRVPRSFDRVAVHHNSENSPYPTEGKGDVTSARWSSLTHSMDGRDVTLALFGRVPPAGTVPSFFTMVQPFTYLAVTQALDKTPLRYAAGDTFALEYLLVVYPERKQPEYLEKRYQNWTQP